MHVSKHLSKAAQLAMAIEDGELNGDLKDHYDRLGRIGFINYWHGFFCGLSHESEVEAKARGESPPANLILKRLMAISPN